MLQTPDNKPMNRSATAAYHRINKPHWSHAVILTVIRLIHIREIYDPNNPVYDSFGSHMHLHDYRFQERQLASDSNAHYWLTFLALPNTDDSVSMQRKFANILDRLFCHSGIFWNSNECRKQYGLFHDVGVFELARTTILKSKY